MCMFKFIFYLPRNIGAFLVLVYQKTLSPDHGIFKGFFPNGYCKFNPTCSTYMYQSIRKYGLVRGGLKGFWRILRCNPCSHGGADHLE